MRDTKERVQVEEMAKSLAVPRHFLGKIMKRVVKAGVLDSTKGPYGGFSINDRTLNTPVLMLVRVTDGMEQFNNCVLHFRKCNKNKPCPLHNQIEKNRNDLLEIFSTTLISDLMQADKAHILESIALT